MIENLLLIFISLLMLLPIYMLLKNERVYRFRLRLIDELRIGNKNFDKLRKVYLRYSYNQMMYSFRSLKSYEKELFGDIRKIKQGGRK